MSPRPRKTNRATPVGDWLQQQRASAGLTQEDLAARSGVGRPQLAAIEAGARLPSHETLTRLAEALGVELPWQVSR